MTKNSIFLLVPYKYYGQWVFDDETVGLKREAFILGADRVMDILSKDFPSGDKGFKLFFSIEEFPGSHRFEWHSSAGPNSNYYFWPEHDLVLFLCPALLLYYPEPPKYIYAAAQPLN